MLRIIGIVLFLIVLVVGIEFSAINSDPVTVNYFLGTASWPLSLVVVCAFSIGVLVAVMVGFAILLPLRLKVGKLKRAISDQESEILALHKRQSSGTR